MADSEILFVVKADNKQAVDALQKVQSQFDGVTAKTRSLASATQNSNMMLMSTSRIVQDLPYGFMAVGNNITFLAEQMAYASTQGVRLKDQFRGLLSSLLGTGGLIFAISTAVSVITMLERSSGSTKGKVESLTESLKEHWSEIYKSRKEWEKFSEELKKFTVKDLGESFRALNQDIKNFRITGIEGILASMGIFQPMINSMAELSKMQQQRSMVLDKFITTTYDPEKTLDRVKKLLTEEKKIVKEYKELQDAMSEVFMPFFKGLNSGNVDNRRIFGMKGVPMPKNPLVEITSEEMAQINELTSVITSSADILRDEFMQVWEDVFGEANSLVEKLFANIANHIANTLAMRAAGSFLNFLIPGASAFLGLPVFKQSTTGTQVNLEMNGETLAKWYVNGQQQAQRYRQL